MKARILFDGPPGPQGGRFVEVEDCFGNSMNIGEWIRIAYPGSAPKVEYWALEIDIIHPGETCEDRNYGCCDLTPPPQPWKRDREWHDWYESHVDAFYRRERMLEAAEARREQLRIKEGLK